MVDEHQLSNTPFLPLKIRVNECSFSWTALFGSGEAYGDSPSLLSTAQHFSNCPGTVFLSSSAGRGEHSILALCPWLTIKYDSGKYGSGGFFVSRQNQLGEKETTHLQGDPFLHLKSLLQSIQLSGVFPEPVTAGLFGYFGFELKDKLEELPSTVIPGTPLPALYLVAPRYLLSHHLPSGKLTLYSTVFEDENDEQVVKEFKELVEKQPRPESIPDSDEPKAGFFHSNFTKEEFIAAAKKAKEYIQQGEIYQVNLAQTFQAEFFGSPFQLFLKLLKENPAEYFAFINGGDFQIISSSPERFLTVRNRRIKTSPIKGTRPRGKTTSEDLLLKEELEKSKKEQAELSMIVDLMRNDLSRVSEAGSVQVAAHGVIEEYSNVFHLVSHITGTLSPQFSGIDLIRACFPPGSISGCPKIRALKVIDELEPSTRGVYTGAIGYISFHGTLDLSVAIRTAVHFNNTLTLSLGSGIVAESNPLEEYEETLHKGGTFWKVLGENEWDVSAKNLERTDHHQVWMNGRFFKSQEAKVSVLSRAFLYGAGVFETIRVSERRCELLEPHMKRFKSSYFELFGENLPEVNFHSVANELLKKNRLSAGLLKLVAGFDEPGKPPIIMAQVKPYHGPYGPPELLGVGDNLPTLKLLTYPERRESPLASHKTLNYLYYAEAGEWAKRNGGDYAVICNADGSISETNATNILGIKGRTVLRPYSRHVLPGIMESEVLKILQSKSYVILHERLDQETLKECDQILITNSLIGCLPAKFLRAQ